MKKKHNKKQKKQKKIKKGLFVFLFVLLMFPREKPFRFQQIFSGASYI